MDETNNSERKNNIFIKILLSLTLLILFGIGGYSVYKIYSDRKELPENKISEATNFSTPSPSPDNSNVVITPNETLPLTGLTNTPVPTAIIPSVTPTSIVVLPSPAFVPTNKPTSVPTVKLSSTPTPTLKPSITSALTAISPTPTQNQSLPVAGYSLPTIFLFLLGIFLILPIILI